MNLSELPLFTQSSWIDQFRDVTFETEVIYLDEDFIKYLNADGVVLPRNACHGAYKVTKENSDCSVSSDSDSWNSKEDDLEKDASANVPSFPILEDKIKSSISKLGGYVFPKFIWSAPIDAAWISLDGSLRCDEPSDIFLLLKSSDIVSRDLTRFNQLQVENKEDLRHSLVLRRWQPPRRNSEFRCFARNGCLVAVCTRYHNQLVSGSVAESCESERVLIVHALQQFLSRVIEPRWRLTSTLKSYVFDVVVRKPRWKDVILVDFAFFGEPTNALLFQWSELTENRLLDAVTSGSEAPLFRVEATAGVLPDGERSCYGFPIDLIHLASGSDPSKLVDLLRIQQQRQTTLGSDCDSDND